MTEDHEPIRDLDAERAVLGCLLTQERRDVPAVAAAVAALRAEHFQLPAHLRLWRSIRDLVDNDAPITEHTLPAELRLDAAELLGMEAVPAQLPHYMGLLDLAAQRRHLRSVCATIERDAGSMDLAEARLLLREAIEARRSSGPFADTWRTVAEWSAGTGVGWLDALTPPEPRTWLLTRDEYGDDGRPRPVGLLPLGKVGMIAAAGGVGKTMTLCQLALAVAVGRPWLGCFGVATVGRVLLALGEEDAEEAHRRLWQAARVLQLTDEQRELAARRVVVLPLAGNPDMALTREEADGSVETDAARALRARMEDKEWRLVILDPASRFAGPDMEKDNSAATRFVQVLEKFAAAPGNPTVLVAHHTSQAARRADPGDATAARGVTGLSDAMRWQANLISRPRIDGAPDLSVFRVTKNNYAPPAPDAWLCRQVETGGALWKATDADRDAYRMAEEAAAEAAGETTERRKAAANRGKARAKDPKTALLDLD
ncbi:MAG: AAA family ATPase [Armatimonadetes bacterium]|nr:AAA family ATPase [Armatimonadota bacterium]